MKEYHLTPVEIKLRYGDQGHYHPATKEDEMLLSHAMNDDHAAVNKEGLKKASVIARAHGWEIKVVD